MQVVRDREVEDVEVGVLEQRRAGRRSAAARSGSARTSASASGLVSQTASRRGWTGWSSSAAQRPIAAASSRPIRPPPTIPIAGDAHASVWQRLLGRRALVHDRHQRARHRRRVGVLDDVAPVDDPGRALLEQRVRALEDLLVGDPPAAADQQRDARDRDDAVVVGEVVGRVGLDDVGAELDRLADDAADAVDVAAARRSRPPPARTRAARPSAACPARSHSARSWLIASTQSRRSPSWPGTSSRLTTTQAASRRTAWPTGSSIMNDHASAGGSGA